MKKIVFILFFSALLFTGYVQAQRAAYWQLTGNALLSSPSFSFLGTTDASPIIFTTDNTERMRLMPDKPFLGIGTSNPQALLHLHKPSSIQAPVLRLTNDQTGPYDLGFTIFNLGSKSFSIGIADEGGALILHGGSPLGVIDEGIQISSNGNVSIGQIRTPAAKLDVFGSFRARSANIIDTLSAQTANINGTLNAGSLNTPTAYIFDALTAGTVYVPGTTTTSNLRVKDLLCAKEIKVQLTSCWPDYVFSQDYKLLPLSEVEQFINENQHLPNIPSSAEVEANGIDLGEMNAKLLQKVEELTMYLLQQEKKMAALQNQIDELKKQ